MGAQMNCLIMNINNICFVVKYLVGLEVSGQVNTIKVMSSQSVNLTTLFLASPLKSSTVLVHILSPETTTAIFESAEGRE